MGSLSQSINPGYSGLSEDTEPLSVRRQNAILKNTKADFQVIDNPKAQSNAPWYAIKLMSDVNNYKTQIETSAKKAGVDPDLVKAIVYLETTQGWYDRFAEPVDKNDSIRPMNIQSGYWEDLGYSRQDLKNPAKNIEAGTKLLAKIQKNMPEASAAAIGTVYNNLGATKISDYGARIQRLYEEKPWEELSSQ